MILSYDIEYLRVWLSHQEIGFVVRALRSDGSNYRAAGRAFSLRVQSGVHPVRISRYEGRIIELNKERRLTEYAIGKSIADTRNHCHN